MNDSVFFATFDPLYFNAPEACSLCITLPPIFTYEHCVEEANGQRQYLKGFCCAKCAQQLLQKLANTEAKEWEEEEAALEADDLDVTDFQKRRLATFGSDLRK